MRIDRLLKILGNRRRLMILKFLLKEKRAVVTEIAGHLKLSIHATSRHLQKLSHVDILVSEPHSRYVQYELAKPLHPLVRLALDHLD